MGLVQWEKLTGSLMTTDRREKDIARCSLVSWLLRIRQRQAANPLDKIYSVLGLIQDLQGNGELEDAGLDALIVDYSASVEDVYSSLVRAVVVKTRNLKILAACATRGPLIRRSWTPDWTQDGENDLATYDLMLHGTDGTGSDAFSGRECNVLFADNLSTLSAEGIFWDTIAFKTTNLEFNDPLKQLRVAQRHLPKIVAKELFCIWGPISSRGFFINEGRYDLYKDYPPSTTWVQQFRCAFEESNVLYLDPPPSLLDLVSKSDQTNLKTSEDIVQMLKLAFGDLMAGALGTVLATEKGYIGETTGRCQVGDIICVLVGCDYPVILRPVEGHYEFIGTAYLPGIMHGQVIQANEEGKVQSQVFELH